MVVTSGYINERNFMDRLGMLNLEIVKVGENANGDKVDRRYVFSMPIGAPYQECYDVAIEMAKEVILMSEEANKKFEEESKKFKTDKKNVKEDKKKDG